MVLAAMCGLFLAAKHSYYIPYYKALFCRALFDSSFVSNKLPVAGTRACMFSLSQRMTDYTALPISSSIRYAYLVTQG